MRNLTFKAAMLNDSRTTVNRQSTDGQSQRHYKQTPLSKRWKVLMTLVFLFTFAIGNVWGAINNTTVTKAGSSQKYIDVTTTAASTGDEVTVAKQYIAYTINDLVSTAIKGVWYTQSSGGSGSSNTDAVSITGYRSACNKYIGISSSKTYTHYVTNCVSFSALYDPRGTRYCTITATNVDDEEDILTITNSGSVSSGTKYNVELTGLSASKYYRVVVETNNGSDSRIYQIRLGALVNSDGPFAVTYDKNNEGASGTMTDANSPYAKNASVTVLGNSFTAPTGMVFAGWNTKANGSGTSYAAGNTFNATEDVTLYAQWAYPATGTGTITYALTSNKNEVTPSVSGVSTLSSSSTAFALSTLTCGSGNEKTGYSGQIQGHAVDYSASQYVALQFTVTDGYTFTPSSLSFITWVRSSNVMKTKVVISDGITSIESNELTSTADTDCPITFAAGAFTGKKLTGNVNITMYQWGAESKRSYIKSPVTITGTVAAAAPKYDVVFANGGEGTGDMATLKYEAGEVVTLPACGYTPASGREFNGWTSSDVTISAGKFTMPSNNVTITATWRDEAVKYTVTYDVNGGSSATPTETDKAVGDEFALAAAPEYDGYHFEGWLCDADALTYDAEDAYTMTAANTTFTAQWKPYSSISIANKTYIIGIGDFNAVSDFSSNSDGAMSYALKEAYTGVTLSSAGVFSATVAGDYIVVANQAANATYAATSKEFTVTVLDSELSDIYIWQKNADHGGDGKCVTSAQANQNVNANQASTTLDYSKLVMDGMSAMGRPASPSTVTLTFSVKDAYKSSFGITNVCVYGKIEEAGGLEYSWNNVDWTAVAGGESGNNKHEFTAPAGTYAENFYIRFTNAEAGKGGLWFRNTLVTLEAKKTVTGVTEALVGAEINGAAISSENLATLLASKTLAIATAYAAAPTVTFKKQVTTTYSGGWSPDVENVDVEVTASDNTTDWQASATINAQEYTITIAKPTAPSLETEATAFTLTSAKIATDTKSFTFSGINLTSGNVTIALESSVAGMTVTPAEVTPVAGVITDQEVTITYKSLEDVATDNVNLVVYYDADTKIVLPLTYSSTKGYEDLTSISAATTWNWDGAANAAYGTLGQNDMIILANADVTWDDGFNARAIAGKLQHYYRDGKYAQGLGLKFHTTIQGIVEVTYSNTGGNAARTVNVNGVKGTLSSSNNKEEDKRTESFNVSAGDVLIKGVLVSDDSDQMLRFYEVSFVPTYIVNYWPGEGTGATIVDDNATVVADCPGTFTAPTGKMFYGWKDGENNDVAVGATVTKDMVLTAQWGDIMVAKIGDDMYPSLEAALLHAADGEIVLLQDIDVTAQVEIAAGVTATIDLAGHKIEYTGSTTLSSGVILVHNGASLTINDSSNPDAGSIVSGDKAYAAVALTKLGDDASTPATLVVNGGALTGHYYGITGNGSRNNTIITINGGTITGTVGIAIYHPQVGTLTVNDGSLTGVDAAIEMRAGTLVINDGTFTATATEFSCNPNGSGSTTSGAAIAIAQHTTKKDISVTINGGTFNGVKALNESNPQVNDPAPQVTMAVTAGTFTGEVTTVDVDKFISGGTFNHPVLEEQCAEGYMPKDNGGGSYGVQYAGVIRGAAVKETIGGAEIPMYTLDNGVKIYSSGSNGQVSTSSNFNTGSDVAVCGGDAGKYSFNSNHIILKFPKNVSGFKIFGTGNTQRSINKVYSNATAGTDVQIKNVGVEHTGTFTGDKEQTAGKWCQYVEAVFDANNTIAKDEYVYVNLDGSMYAYRVIFTEAECTTPTVSLAGKSAYAGTEVTLTAEASALGATYTWYRCDDATGANPQVIAGKTAASYTFTKAVENEYIKVVVGCNCSTETAEAVATILTRVDVTLQDVTDSITWDFSKSGIAAETNIPSEIVLANIPAVNNDKNFWSDKIQAGAGKLRAGYYQGGKLLFHTTVPGLLTVEFSNTGSGTRPFRELLINGNPTDAKSKDNTHVTYKVAVKSGDIELTARIYDNDGNPTANTSTLNFYLVDFDADLSNNAITEDVFNGYTRDVTEGRYGTICLPNGGIMVGAELYEVAYYDGTYEKIFLDEVLNGEMVAGRPYIFLTKEGVDKIAVFYTDEANAPEGDYHGLFGSYSKIHLTANDHIYILKDNRYYFVDTDNVYCGANRAYFKMGVAGGISGSYVAPAPGRRRMSIGAGAPKLPTGIENTGFESEAPRKVLINGELYIIRGEKMYDAKGQLVK